MNIYLDVPGTNKKLYSGSKIKLGRFENTIWIVLYGWYTWGYNRPVCGWYLNNIEDSKIIKPLNFTDFDDIIMIEQEVVN